MNETQVKTTEPNAVSYPPVDEHGLLGKTAIYRDENGIEHAALLINHNGEGIVHGFVWDRVRRGAGVMEAVLVKAREVDVRREWLPGEDVPAQAENDPTDLRPKAPCFYEYRPAIRIGTDVMFRATKGALANPQLPENIVGVLPGKVVAFEGDSGMLKVMIFPPVGTIMVASHVRPVPTDLEQPGSCWIEP